MKEIDTSDSGHQSTFSCKMRQFEKHHAFCTHDKNLIQYSFCGNIAFLTILCLTWGQFFYHGFRGQ